MKEQQKALLMQVMQLTDEQINALAPEHRDQIRQLVSVFILVNHPIHCYPHIVYHRKHNWSCRNHPNEYDSFVLWLIKRSVHFVCLSLHTNCQVVVMISFVASLTLKSSMFIPGSSSVEKK